MRQPALALLAAIVFVVGCTTSDIAQPSLGGCSPSTVITAGLGISDYKQRIARQVSLVPTDTVLDVIITFTTAVVQSDRDRIAAYGGINVASAGTVSTLKAQFVAPDLASYVSEDTTGRLSDVTIYDPACSSN